MKRLLAVAAVVVCAIAAAPASAADPDAPNGAPDSWLPDEQWVNLLWLPYDEQRLYDQLKMTRGEVFRWVRIDATNTLAALGRRRGLSVKTLARRLVANRRVRPAMRKTLVRHAERTLTQAHLGQHLLFHALHQTAIPARARWIFGVRSNREFLRLRRAELSPLQIGELHRRTRVSLLHRASRALRDAVRKGVRSGNLSARQGEVMLDRQLRQVPRWLGQNRYNGPSGGRNAPDIPPGDVAKHPSISADGTRVVWDAYRQTVREAERKGEIHVSATDLGVLRRFEISPRVRPGSRRPHSAYNSVVSADGSAVAFETAASTFPLAKRVGQMSVLVRDVRSGRVDKVSHAALPKGAPTRTAFNPSISGDGRLIVFEATDSGTPSTNAVWLYDRAARTQRKLLDQKPGSAAYLPEISADGTTVAYTEAAAGGRTQVWVQDVASGARTLVSQASRSDAFEPALSADGRTVAFTSGTEVLVRDAAGATSSVSGAVRGAASQPAISADGRYVTLVERLRPRSYTLPGLRSRVWRYDRVTRRTALVAPAGGWATEPAISADGARVAFASTAGNLVRRKPQGLTGIFVRDIARATTTLLSAHGGSRARASAASADHELLCTLAP